MYKIYQFTVGILDFTFISCMMYTVIKKVMIDKESEKYYQTVHMLPELLLVFIKFSYVNYKREKLIHLTSYFTSVEFKCSNDFEKHKEKNIEKFIR